MYREKVGTLSKVVGGICTIDSVSLQQSIGYMIYEKKKRRAFELEKQATDLLASESKRVSHRAVAQKSKEIDPDGIGIHANTIFSNKELHEYISQHSTSKSSKARGAPRMPQEELSSNFLMLGTDGTKF